MTDINISITENVIALPQNIRYPIDVDIEIGRISTCFIQG